MAKKKDYKPKKHTRIVVDTDEYKLTLKKFRLFLDLNGSKLPDDLKTELWDCFNEFDEIADDNERTEYDTSIVLDQLEDCHSNMGWQERDRIMDMLEEDDEDIFKERVKDQREDNLLIIDHGGSIDKRDRIIAYLERHIFPYYNEQQTAIQY